RSAISFLRVSTSIWRASGSALAGSLTGSFLSWDDARPAAVARTARASRPPPTNHQRRAALGVACIAIDLPPREGRDCQGLPRGHPAPITVSLLQPLGRAGKPRRFPSLEPGRPMPSTISGYGEWETGKERAGGSGGVASADPGGWTAA